MWPTDPPYFNNVHYSELADFFHAWLGALGPHADYPAHLLTTRDESEVQDTDVEKFGASLAAVLTEASRVLKPDGMLVFSFHHGTTEAWRAVVSALAEAEMAITAVQPVKAEMSTSSTKNGAKEPNDLDSMVVARHLPSTGQHDLPTSPTQAARAAVARLQVLRDSGVHVGLGDVRSVVTGSAMAIGTHGPHSPDLERLASEASEAAQRACEEWSR